MTFEIRNLTIDELDEAWPIFAQAFGRPDRHDPASVIESTKARFDSDSYLGVFEDGEMTSMMRMIEVGMYLNGGVISHAAVSPVANSPLHRRKGHSGAMLRRSLEQMREQGQALAGLYTPHPAFYRRYGWEVASEWRSYRFEPKDFSLSVQPSQRGRFRFAKQPAWPILDPIFRASATNSNGAFDRPESWWSTYVTNVPWRPDADIVVWSTGAAVDEGYAIYRQPSVEGANYPVTNIPVHELMAASRDAYLNLLGYFGRHDIHNEVTIEVAPHDPLPLVFADGEKLESSQGSAVMLRVVDFEAAMHARLPADPTEAAEVTLRIHDDTAPWNGGTWRIGIAEGKTRAERTQAEAEVTLPARALGPLFNGYVTPRAASKAGLLEADGDDALARVTRVFAVTQPPFFPDHF